MGLWVFFQCVLRFIDSQAFYGSSENYLRYYNILSILLLIAVFFKCRQANSNIRLCACVGSRSSKEQLCCVGKGAREL